MSYVYLLGPYIEVWVKVKFTTSRSYQARQRGHIHIGGGRTAEHLHTHSMLYAFAGKLRVELALWRVKVLGEQKNHTKEHIVHTSRGSSVTAW